MLALAGLFPAATALAQDRSFCAERPGMGTPACTLDKGQAMVEVTLFARDRISAADAVTEGQTFADTLLRIGLGDDTELQIGHTGYVRLSARDRATGARIRAEGVGDSYLAVRRSIGGPGPLAAIEGFVVLPTGDDAVSAGDWSAGVVAPVELPSDPDFPVALTPEIFVLPDSDDSGHHLGYGAILGVSHQFAPDWGASVETSVFQNDDPGGGTFTSGVAGTLAWQASDRLQFSVEMIVGMIEPAPRTIVMGGFALRL